MIPKEIDKSDQKGDEHRRHKKTVPFPNIFPAKSSPSYPKQNLLPQHTYGYRRNCEYADKSRCDAYKHTGGYDSTPAFFKLPILPVTDKFHYQSYHAKALYIIPQDFGSLEKHGHGYYNLGYGKQKQLSCPQIAAVPIVQPSP